MLVHETKTYQIDLVPVSVFYAQVMKLHMRNQVLPGFVMRIDSDFEIPYKK